MELHPAYKTHLDRKLRSSLRSALQDRTLDDTHPRLDLLRPNGQLELERTDEREQQDLHSEI